jgi:hypothetical protein
MQLTGGTRALTGTAGATVAGGLSAVLYGTLRNDIARAVGGTCVTLTALTVVALVLIRQWIRDTADDRRLLAAAQREAQAERSRYFAAQAALEVEQGRLARDRSAEQRADAARLKAEREVMASEFEERRAALIAETMEATVLMMRGGELNPPPSGNLIPFPHQQAERQPERARSREHGVVGP